MLADLSTFYFGPLVLGIVFLLLFGLVFVFRVAFVVGDGAGDFTGLYNAKSSDVVVCQLNRDVVNVPLRAWLAMYGEKEI